MMPAGPTTPGRPFPRANRGRQLLRDGEPWDVYELATVPHQGASLVFESRTAVRRVHDFPADWQSLSDDELWDVSWRR